MAEFFIEPLAGWCDTLVAVLAHSLWQGLLISVGVWVVLRTVPSRYTNLRYAASVAGLGAVVLAALATWSVVRLPGVALDSSDINSTVRISATTTPRPTAHVDGSAPSAVPMPTGSVKARIEADEGTPAATESRWMNRLHAVKPTIVVLWLVGVCLMLVRTTTAVVQTQRWARLDTTENSFDLSGLESLAVELSARLKLWRVVKLVACDRINVPAVLGTVWPVILIPPAMLTGVSIDQWRIVLAHELAHVRRYDSLVNLVQMLVESLFFFNPAVWWISRQVRTEREACCDALAVQVSGQPLSVARTLVEVAQSVHEGSTTPSPVPLTAFAEPNDTGSLTDRVRRLVQPNLASRPRLTWLGLLTATLVLVATGAVLQRGTDLAVRAAAELMSPKERVDTLARLQAERNGVFVTSGVPAKDDETTASPKSEEGSKPDSESVGPRKVKVTIVVRTDDGSPIPARMNVQGFYATGRSSTSTTLAHTREGVPEYSLTRSFPPCRLLLGVSAPGYAASIVGPRSLFLEDGDQQVDLVLTRGFTATLRLTDKAGNAVPNAQVRVGVRLGLDDGWSSLGPQDLTSDAEGFVRIERASIAEYELQARARGYQHAKRRLTFEPDKTVDWSLTAARPTAVRIVDSATGQPVPEAKLVVILWSTRPKSSHSFGDPRNWSSGFWTLFGETDADGRTVLDELRDGHTYAFGVRASGYGIGVLDGVKGGQEQHVVRLHAPVRVTGRLIGPLDSLKWTKRRGQTERYLHYRNDFDLTTGNYSGLFRATVDENGRFELPDLVPGEVKLILPNGEQRLEVRESQTDLTIRMDEIANSAASSSGTTREVILRLMGTTPDAPVRGKLDVHPQSPDRSAHGPLPIINNEVRLTAPAPAQLRFRPQDVVGYFLEEQQSVQIVPGSGPQVIEIPTRPAGAVHGRILRPDGSAAVSAGIHVFSIRMPRGLDDQTRVNPSVGYGSSTFFRSLPLGGRYRLLAREFTDTAAWWTVSDEFTLDKAHPIQELDVRLRPSRRVTVRVLDSNGRPFADVTVKLLLSFAGGHHTSSSSVTHSTGPDGIARFENTTLTGDTGPVKVTVSADIAPPPGHIGWRGELNDLRSTSSSDYEVRLKRGVSASGILIDSTTGRPIPDAEVRVVPTDFRGAAYFANIRTTTNERGEFHFDNLEPIDYRGYIDETVPKGTVVTPLPGGGYRFSYPDGPTEHRLHGGSRQSVKWHVQILPDSGLKPVLAK